MGISWRHFGDFLATFWGFLGDNGTRKPLRFKALRASKTFIYFIYIIKCIIGALLADANALLLYLYGIEKENKNRGLRRRLTGGRRGAGSKGKRALCKTTRPRFTRTKFNFRGKKHTFSALYVRRMAFFGILPHPLSNENATKTAKNRRSTCVCVGF